MGSNQAGESTLRSRTPLKFVIGGVLIAAAILYLIVSSLTASAKYFLTVDDAVALNRTGDLDGRNIRVSGAVLGDTILYDSDTLSLSFTIAHVPADNQLLAEQGGLAQALHNAVVDPSRARLDVIYSGAVPDLLQDEAQAILTGQLLPSGVFQAEEILLKCPTKYAGSLPDQIDPGS